MRGPSSRTPHSHHSKISLHSCKELFLFPQNIQSSVFFKTSYNLRTLYPLGVYSFIDTKFHERLDIPDTGYYTIVQGEIGTLFMDEHQEPSIKYHFLLLMYKFYSENSYDFSFPLDKYSNFFNNSYIYLISL